jgi:putative holliday junction resolvase
MNSEQLIGLDVGLKKTGIARASYNARLAEPISTVPTATVLNAIKELAEEYNVKTIVVGLPRNLHGDDTKQTTWVRDWVNHAKRKIDLPIYWQDEALTSRVAEAKKLTYKKPHDVDALAAAIILQDFLDTPESDRVMS